METEELQELWLCTNSPEFVDRARVALHPYASAQMLIKLSKDNSLHIRAFVANNKSTPIEVLEEMATNDWSIEVRRNAQDSLKERTEVKVNDISCSISKCHPSVKLSVANNLNTPLWILEKLAKESDYTIRRAVARHPRIPIPLLKHLAKDSDWYVRKSAVENSNIPIELLIDLAKDEKSSVRGAVAIQEKTPIEILIDLTLDEVKEVRVLAIKQLATGGHNF